MTFICDCCGWQELSDADLDGTLCPCGGGTFRKCVYPEPEPHPDALDPPERRAVYDRYFLESE